MNRDLWCGLAVCLLGCGSGTDVGNPVETAAQSAPVASDDGSLAIHSAIHVFAMDSAAPRYRGTGAVPGRLLNQFAMSEHREVLRVATTDGATSGVYTLDLASDDYPLLGKVEGLGKGGSIYAVRFVGHTGYVVTFKKIDPLFVIDLADPRAPTVAGELKIPGFSTYLHPLDDDTIGVLTLIGNRVDLYDLTSFEKIAGVGW